MFEQGDIVSIYFPFTDGKSFKKRPALVISNKRVNQTGDYIVVQITSKIYEDNLSLSIEEQDCDNSLPLKSYIRSHKIFTIHHNRILAKINTAKSSLLIKLATKIKENIER